MSVFPPKTNEKHPVTAVIPVLENTHTEQSSADSKPPEDHGAWLRFYQDSDKQLQASFSNFDEASKYDKNVVDQYFNTKEYTPHAATMREHRSGSTAKPGQTLAEQIEAIVGRR